MELYEHASMNSAEIKIPEEEFPADEIDDAIKLVQPHPFSARISEMFESKALPEPPHENRHFFHERMSPTVNYDELNRSPINGFPEIETENLKY